MTICYSLSAKEKHPRVSLCLNPRLVKGKYDDTIHSPHPHPKKSALIHLVLGVGRHVCLGLSTRSCVVHGSGLRQPLYFNVVVLGAVHPPRLQQEQKGMHVELPFVAAVPRPDKSGSRCLAQGGTGRVPGNYFFDLQQSLHKPPFSVCRWGKLSDC